jgi:hypothetical protein
MTDKDMLDPWASRLRGQTPRAVATINKPMNLGGMNQPMPETMEARAMKQRQAQGMPLSPTDPERWRR